MTANAFKTNESFRVVGAMTRVAVNTAQTITLPSTATGILISFEGQPVRLTLDNSTPTSTNGFLLPVNTLYRFDMHQGGALRVLESAASAFANYNFIVTLG